MRRAFADLDGEAAPGIRPFLLREGPFDRDEIVSPKDSTLNVHLRNVCFFAVVIRYRLDHCLDVE